MEERRLMMMKRLANRHENRILQKQNAQVASTNIDLSATEKAFLSTAASELDMKTPVKKRIAPISSDSPVLSFDEKADRQIVALSTWCNTMIGLDESEEMDLGSTKKEACQRIQEMLRTKKISEEEKTANKSKYHKIFEKNDPRQIRQKCRQLLQDSGIEEGISQMLSKNAMTVRTELTIFSDLALQTSLLRMFLSFHPAWLKAALEAVFNSQIETSPNRLISQLSRFIIERVFTNPDLLKNKKYAQGSGKRIITPAGKEALHRHFLLSIMKIMFLIERGHLERIIPNVSRMFAKSSSFKNLDEMFAELSKEILSGSSMPMKKAFARVGFTSSYQQSFYDNYCYVAKDFEDFSNGIILAKLVETVGGMKHGSLLCRLRDPAGDRIRKLKNVEVVLAEMQKIGIETEGIKAAQIVGAKKEAVLSILWSIIGVRVTEGKVVKTVPRRDYQENNENREENVVAHDDLEEYVLNLCRCYGRELEVDVPDLESVLNGHLLSKAWNCYIPVTYPVQFYDGDTMWEKVVDMAEREMRIAHGIHNHLPLFVKMYFERLHVIRMWNEKAATIQRAWKMYLLKKKPPKMYDVVLRAMDLLKLNSDARDSIASSFNDATFTISRDSIVSERLSDINVTFKVPKTPRRSMLRTDFAQTPRESIHNNRVFEQVIEEEEENETIDAAKNSSINTLRPVDETIHEDPEKGDEKNPESVIIREEERISCQDAEKARDSEIITLQGDDNSFSDACAGVGVVEIGNPISTIPSTDSAKMNVILENESSKNSGEVQEVVILDDSAPISGGLIVEESAPKCVSDDSEVVIIGDVSQNELRTPEDVLVIEESTKHSSNRSETKTDSVVMNAPVRSDLEQIQGHSEAEDQQKCAVEEVEKPENEPCHDDELARKKREIIENAERMIAMTEERTRKIMQAAREDQEEYYHSRDGRDDKENEQVITTPELREILRAKRRICAEQKKISEKLSRYERKLNEVPSRSAVEVDVDLNEAVCDKTDELNRTNAGHEKEPEDEMEIFEEKSVQRVYKVFNSPDVGESMVYSEEKVELVEDKQEFTLEEEFEAGVPMNSEELQEISRRKSGAKIEKLDFEPERMNLKAAFELSDSEETTMNVPVTHVENKKSEKEDEESNHHHRRVRAVITIQRIFRGYWVRRDLRVQIDEMQKRVMEYNIVVARDDEDYEMARLVQTSDETRSQTIVGGMENSAEMKLRMHTIYGLSDANLGVVLLSATIIDRLTALVPALVDSFVLKFRGVEQILGIFEVADRGYAYTRILEPLARTLRRIVNEKNSQKFDGVMRSNLPKLSPRLMHLMLAHCSNQQFFIDMTIILMNIARNWPMNCHMKKIDFYIKKSRQQLRDKSECLLYLAGLESACAHI